MLNDEKYCKRIRMWCKGLISKDVINLICSQKCESFTFPSFSLPPVWWRAGIFLSSTGILSKSGQNALDISEKNTDYTMNWPSLEHKLFAANLYSIITTSKVRRKKWRDFIDINIIYSYKNNKNHRIYNFFYYIIITTKHLRFRSQSFSNKNVKHNNNTKNPVKFRAEN